MKVVVNKVDALKRELDIEIPENRVKQKFDQVYELIKKEAKVPGFRPGTAPRHILEKYHAKDAHEEVLKQLLPETYHEALQQEKLDAIALPEITDVTLNPSVLRYKAKVELRPDIDIKSYKGIKVKKRSDELTDEELQKSLDQIKKSKKIEELSDDFAHGLGYANLDEFKSALKKQLAVQKENDNRALLERDVIDFLLKNSNFTVPEALVEKRFEELKQEMRDYLARAQMPATEIEKKEKELDAKIREQATEQVKVFLVLDEIARKENITRDDHMPNHVMEFLFKNADWS